MYLPFLATLFIIVQGRNEYDRQLMHDLIFNYGAPIRPFQNESIPTNVSVLISLRKILNIDYRHQILYTQFWVFLKWNDYKLRWNDSEYGGITTSRIPHSKIWTPDIVLLNNVDPSYGTSITKSLAIVQNTGTVSWYLGAVFRSSCGIDISNFPFDVQTCNLIWASWVYDIEKLDLILDETITEHSRREDNEEIELLSCHSKKIISHTRVRQIIKPYIRITLKLRRKSLTYIFNFIIPCSLISATGLLVFYVPCPSGEKVTLGISALVSISVFLLKITNALPPTQIMPIISLYYVSSMCLVTFATGLAVVNLNVYHLGERRNHIPQTLKFILNIISGSICIPQLSSRIKNSTKIRKCKMNQTNSIDDKIFIRRQLNLIQNCRLDTANIREIDKQKLVSIILQLDDMLRHQERLIKDDELNEKLNEEWTHASVVLDRGFLIIFVLISIFTTIFILCS